MAKSGIIKNIKHIVFENVAEFEDYFLKEQGVVPVLIENWRLGVEGDWVLADDGGVVQILRSGEMAHPHDRKNWRASTGWCRTIVGSFIKADKYKMDTDFDRHVCRYTFSTSIPENDKSSFRNRKNLTKAERIFTMAVIVGKSPEVAVFEAYGPKGNWREKFLALIKTERVSNEIIKGVSSLAKKHGIDEEYILLQYKDILDSNCDAKAKISALRELSELIGMKNKALLRTSELHKFNGFSGGDMDEITTEISGSVMLSPGVDNG